MQPLARIRLTCLVARSVCDSRASCVFCCFTARLHDATIVVTGRLWARRAVDIDRLLHDPRSAATASSVTLSADVGGWTQRLVYEQRFLHFARVVHRLRPHLPTTKQDTINPGSYNGFEHPLIECASSVLYACSRLASRGDVASSYNLFIVMSGEHAAAWSLRRIV